MRYHGGILLILALTSTVRGGDAKEAGDLKALQGTWTVVSMEQNGRPVPPDRIENRVMVIVGKTFIDQAGDKILGEGTLTLDPSKTPKAIDAAFTEGPPKGKTGRAIYELDGDTLRVCSAKLGDERPRAFGTRPGSELMMVFCKRAR